MIRILGSEGQILKSLIRKGRKSAPQISVDTGLGKGTTYYTLKELIARNYVKECEGVYEVTEDGVKAFWSVILNDELAARLVSASKDLGISTYELVELGVRLILDILERGVLPAELQRLLNEYDPSLVSRLKEVVVSV